MRKYSLKTSGGLQRLLIGCGAGLLLAPTLVWTQVERPAAGAVQPEPGMGGSGMAAGGMAAGRSQTPPDPAVAADPRNFSGMWQQATAGGGGMAAGGTPPAAMPAGVAVGMGAATDDAAVPVGKSPKLLCVPQAGSIYAGGVGGVQFIQTPTQINIVAEENHRVRRIYINGEHPKNLVPSYMGHSVGKWEGNTLVVDTTGVKGSADTHSIERITKNAAGTSLEVRTTTVDANGRSMEGRTMTLNWLSGRDVAEWICEDYSDEFFSDDYR